VSTRCHGQVAAQHPHRDLGGDTHLVALDTAGHQLDVVVRDRPGHVRAGRSQVLQGHRAGQRGQVGSGSGPPPFDHQTAADQQHDRDQHQGAGQAQHRRSRRAPLPSP
jgi:hypothetical protein